ncbi:NACHT domain-containing protein [Streptomyces sp. NPDC006290]|uniref:NACHT domain-containing protein n=1 Tax=Streptomyces sp. NPDC006290 TaxID=3156745 RepID=UPI0033AA5D81
MPGLTAVGVFAGVTLICAVVLLPVAVRNTGTRWGVACALGVTVAACAAWWRRAFVTGEQWPGTVGPVNQITGGRFQGLVIQAGKVTIRRADGEESRPHYYETWLARAESRIEDGRRGSLRELARIELDLADLPGHLDFRPEVVLRREGRAAHQLAGGIVEAWSTSQHSLLLLGVPGAGKSTMLLDLADDLVSTARRDAGRRTLPIPVIVDLRDWRARRIGRRPRRLVRRRLFRRARSLDDMVVQETDPAGWLVSWLHASKPYRFRPGWVRKSLESDGLALLFDGLDEVPEQHRAACAGWLNDLCHRYESAPIAVVSRTSEFAWLRRPLALTRAAEIQPLTRRKVETYLRGAGVAADPVRTALASDASLWEVVDAPIWLVIMTLTQRDTAGAPAPRSVEEGRGRLLDSFVARAVHRVRPADRYTPDQTVRWLSHLARLMGSDLRVRRVFIGALEPKRTAESWTAAALVAANTIAAGAVTLPLLRSYGLIVTVSTGLLPLGVLLTLAFQAPSRPVVSPFIGLALGALVVHYEPRVRPGFREWLSGIPVGWMMHYSTPPDPQGGGGGPDIDLHQWISEGQFRDFMALFVPGVLAVVITLALARVADLGHAERLSVPSVLCPLTVIAPFLVGAVEDAPVTGPFQAYYYGVGAITIMVLAAGVVLALPTRGLRFVLEPLSARAGSAARALWSFGRHLARRRIPLRLRLFLRQAADHHLLIRDYDGYSFRHALFRDYFASLDPATAVAPAPPRAESADVGLS